MVSSVTIAERGGEIDTLGRDVLLIAVLSIEVESVFDGPEAAGFVMACGGILDVVKIELVFTGDCDGCVGVGASTLESLITVVVSVFPPQSALTRLASKLLTIDSSRTDSTFCSVMNSASVASDIILSSSMLIVNRTSIVACVGHLLGGHQRRPLPQGSQLLNSRELFDTTRNFPARSAATRSRLAGLTSVPLTPVASSAIR